MAFQNARWQPAMMRVLLVMTTDEAVMTSAKLTVRWCSSLSHTPWRPP